MVDIPTNSDSVTEHILVQLVKANTNRSNKGVLFALYLTDVKVYNVGEGFQDNVFNTAIYTVLIADI